MNDEDRFMALYEADFRSVLGYALRRTERPEDAADLVAETFMVAWRRLDEVPSSDCRPWLIGVARNLLANQRRGDFRRSRLAERLGSTLVAQSEVIQFQELEVDDSLRRAWASLGESDREVLALSAWEDLTAPAIAKVLSLPSATVRTRLHRARRRLRRALQEGPAQHRTTEGLPTVVTTGGDRDE